MKKIVHERPSTDETLARKFAELRNVVSVSCVVGDALERDGIMDSGMKMRSVPTPFIGPALTVRLVAGYLVDCLEIFEHARKGDVVVIDAFGETETSIWGGLMSGLARAAGIAGVVVDGSVRDTDEARMLGFPVVSRSVSPRAAHSAFTKVFEPIELFGDVQAGGVIVRAGDIVVADEIGVTVVPQRDAPQVYERAVEQAQREEATRQEVLKGATVEQLLAKFGRI